MIVVFSLDFSQCWADSFIFWLKTGKADTKAPLIIQMGLIKGRHISRFYAWLYMA